MFGMIPRQMIERLSWTTGSFGVIQLMRLVNNVVLARLLSPPLFGLMLIVNSIRTGVELLSDVGINQDHQGHSGRRAGGGLLRIRRPFRELFRKA
jgi:hypothetical protein